MKRNRKKGENVAMSEKDRKGKIKNTDQIMNKKEKKAFLRV